MFFEESISIWASFTSWLTPTVLFLLLNLMIATIAFTSAFSHHYNHPPNHQQTPNLTPLTRAPSILQRLKSFNPYSYTYKPPPIPLEQHPVPESTHRHDPEPDPVPESHSDDDEEGLTLEEVFSRIQKSGHYGRQNSDTKPTGGEIPVKLPRKMKKSASDKSAFNHFETAIGDVREPPPPPPAARGGGGDEEVDTKADDFISRFRQQLKLQRLESIVRYKDMISRATRNIH